MVHNIVHNFKSNELCNKLFLGNYIFNNSLENKIKFIDIN